ncbi:DHH family phosphoesterase [Clostridium sp. M14]|uniref:DHH family phosphoesterase n=1 Tax=Clostridium sp. M14 TaxID=2716311 RepID=UPI0013EE7E42|nr:DHH family phosphoesterase [Clostridium sp. M14]MBZ9693255.1 DHH family phosphoesterase [Clostridium sp. M14]
MKYKLISRNDFFMPVETVLENRGITKDLFNLDKDVVEDYNNYDNMQKGIELLLKHLNNNSKIKTVGDCDVDGMTSFSILYNRIKESFPNANIELKIHTNKQHGLSEDIIIEDDTNLVIMTDSSSNDFEQHKKLKDKGIDILIIDHHDCDDGYSKNAVVINNQLSKNVINKNLSGAGVVYKFIKALDDYLFEDKSNKYKDLVALGNVADVMDLHELETRYFVYEGVKKVNNLFIKALIEVNAYDLEDKYNIDKIGWVIAPKLNGTIRSGTQEEKMKMFQAFISDDYDFCLEVAKMCKNVKTRQDNAVKSALKKIEPKIQINENDKCIILDVGKSLNQAHTGLVAQKIQDKYKLPTLLYRKVEGEKDVIGGSFRGIDNISTNTRLDILNSDLVIFSEGHPNAGGYKLKKDNLNKLKDYLNDLYKNKEIVDSKEYLVDFILDESEIDDYIINELALLENEFGNKIDVPLIAFQNVELNIVANDIKKTRIVFFVNGIKFNKKFPTNALKKQLLNQSLKANIIGKCTMDTYNNSGQVEIVDFEIK